MIPDATCKKTEKMKKAFLYFGIFIVLQMCVSIIMSIIFFFLGWDASSPQIQTLPAYKWILSSSLLFVNLLICLILYLVMRKKGKSPFTGYTLRPTLGIALLSILTLIVIDFWLNSAMDLMDIKDIMEQAFKGLMENPVGIISICLIGPIAEEFCFRRGILGSLLESNKWRPYALFISAFIFGLVHFNPIQSIGAFILGLFLGWLFMRTHSIVLPVVCHIMNNTMSTVIAIIFGYSSKSTDIFSSRPVFYLAITGSVILSAILIFILNKHMPDEKEKFIITNSITEQMD